MSMWRELVKNAESMLAGIKCCDFANLQKICIIVSLRYANMRALLGSHCEIESHYFTPR